MKRAKSKSHLSETSSRASAPVISEDRSIPIVTIKPGDAIHFPKKGDSCLLHYTGFLENGAIFDSSYNKDRPICIIVGLEQVIAGWDDVIVRMSRGQKARVEIPPEMAYGERGYPPIIPPLATLTYELELISFTGLKSADLLEREL
jgi:FK506-binding protein 1